MRKVSRFEGACPLDERTHEPAHRLRSGFVREPALLIEFSVGCADHHFAFGHHSRIQAHQNLAQVVIASYGVASAIGRLTARDLHLPVPLYDDTAYYNAVKDRWAGLGDYATSQPGR